MPNWCMNSATISGPVVVLENIVEAIKQNKMLEHFAPIGDWEYGLAVDMWGTKWEPEDVAYDLDADAGELRVSFDSAWAPPVDAYNTAMDRLGVEIQADYYEPGMMFVGSFDNGNDMSFEVDFTDETWRDKLPQDMIDAWDLDYEYENYLEWNNEEEDME